MMKVGYYSLSHGRSVVPGKVDVFRFLAFCRELDVDGAALHMGDLESTETPYLARIRRAYLEQGLAVSALTVSTNFALPGEKQAAELKKGMQAVRVASYIGAPLIRIFAEWGPDRVQDVDRPARFALAADGIRRLCVETEMYGMVVGLQNHNHGALCGTGEELVRLYQAIDHPNLACILDTGEFTGSPGASDKPVSDKPTASTTNPAAHLDSIRRVAPLAKYVRAKFYDPRPDGSEPAVDYEEVFKILHGVHYGGFVDIVYQGPAVRSGVSAKETIPRIVEFLRRKIRAT
jgi:sugar phosphate isomerase/epimerase